MLRYTLYIIYNIDFKIVNKIFMNFLCLDLKENFKTFLKFSVSACNPEMRAQSRTILELSKFQKNH